MAEKPNIRALKAFEERMAKRYGAGALMHTAEITPYEVISTGSLALDHALGVGGLVEGRLHEFWGQDGIGKSTLAILALAEAQRKYPTKVVGYIDVEHKIDLQWVRDHGVDLTRCYVIQPDLAEETADILKDMLLPEFSMVVVDSIGAMIPEKEVEKDADEVVVAAQAKIVTRMVKMAASAAAKAGVCVLLINQVRANVTGFGKATTTGGGFALRHVTTTKCEFKRTGTEVFTLGKDTDKVTVGHELAVKVERNNVAPPGRTAFVNLFNQTTEKFGPIGVDVVDEAVTLGLKLGVIQRDGAWYTVPGTGERFQGKEKLVDGLRGQADVVADIRRQVISTRAAEVYDEERQDPDAPAKPDFRRGREGETEVFNALGE
jgi:recombination protein RecA